MLITLDGSGRNGNADEDREPNDDGSHDTTSDRDRNPNDEETDPER